MRREELEPPRDGALAMFAPVHDLDARALAVEDPGHGDLETVRRADAFAAERHVIDREIAAHEGVLCRRMEDEASIRSRPVWPWFLGMALLLGIGAVAWLAWPVSPSPTRVLVAVHGCGGACASALSEALRAQLASTFEVLPGEGTSADAARAAASEQGAEHALFVEVEVHERREASPTEVAYASTTVRARLLSSTGEPDREIRSLRIGTFASSPDEALRAAVLRSAETLAAEIDVALLERPNVVTYTTEDVPNEELDRQSAIRDRIARLPRVREEIEWIQNSCAEAARELARDGGNARCISQACAEEYAFDVLPDGSAALVHGETPGASIAVTRPVARRVETEETLALVPLDGSAPRVLARSDNYYTYPGFGGGRIVAVEDWGREFGLVSIDLEDGARTVLARIARRWVQSPRVSPDGRWIFYHLRAERRAPPQLVVVEARAGATERSIGAAQLSTWVEGPRIAELVEWARVGTPPPVDAIDDTSPPVVQELPMIDATLRLALYDPANGEVTAWLDDDRHEIEAVAGSANGKVVFTWSNGGVCGVGAWQPGGAAAFARTPFCLDHPSATTDGHVVGTARVSGDEDPSPDDDEVVDVDVATGTFRVLTFNALRDRYPRAAGDRVVFDRLGTSRYRAFPRVATCWLTRE